MNVVLEQIRRLYGVPKDVWHKIIQLFRPRAPLGPVPKEFTEKWKVVRWVNLMRFETLYWGLYRLSQHVDGMRRYDMGLWCGQDMVCIYCSCNIEDKCGSICNPCRAAVTSAEITRLYVNLDIEEINE